MKLIKKTLLILLFSTILVACSEKNEAVYPSYRPLVESVYSSVIIEPVGFYKVYATVNGRIDEIIAEEGDVLKRGDAILTIVDIASNYQKQNAALESVSYTHLTLPTIYSV